jgi:hypothetical protein
MKRPQLSRFPGNCRTGIAGLLLLVLPLSPVRAEPVVLQETLVAGKLYRVNSRVDLQGKLTLPAEKDGQEAQSLIVKGTSTIDYDERILSVQKTGIVDRTIRQYHKMEFARKVGDHLQSADLRPEVSRLVLLRHQQMEVPFSPDGPLLWEEIDLVRTDVFTPALRGLLPANPVQVGDTWTASLAAIQELTDFARIEEGSLTCKFEQYTAIADRKHARIGIIGTIRGIGEDGMSRQKLDGYFLFDVVSHHLSYLSVHGVHALLDKDGKTVGQIEGNFVLTRQLLQTSSKLSDASLGQLTLEPSANNTLLLYDNVDLGIRFLYSRRWHVAGVRGNQLGLDEKGGSGVLLTVEPPNRVPTGKQFLQESANWLKEQKVEITQVAPVQLLQKSPRAIEHFSLDVKMDNQPVRMYYFVIRQAEGGVVIAARLGKSDLAELQREVQQITNSVQIIKKR